MTDKELSQQNMVQFLKSIDKMRRGAHNSCSGYSHDYEKGYLRCLEDMTAEIIIMLEASNYYD